MPIQKTGFVEKRVREKPRVRLSTAHNEAIDEFAEQKGLPKTEALEMLMDRVFLLNPLYEHHLEELSRLGKVRGKLPVEVLEQLIAIGRECLPIYEAVVHEREGKVREMFKTQAA